MSKSNDEHIRVVHDDDLPGREMTGHEPHRNWHIYSLGADLLAYGFCGYDADALMGVRGLSASRLIRMLQDDSGSEQPERRVGDLLKSIVDKHRGELEDIGRQLSWDRRLRRYHAALADWKSQPGAVRQGRWRQRPMTARQRALVQVTAGLLDIAIPSGLDRGTAADWLERHGANLAYRGGA